MHGAMLDQHQGLELSTMQYNLLISACARTRPRRALAIFRRMQASAVACDAVSYNNAIAAASRSSNLELALQLFEQMVKAGIPPTTISFNRLGLGLGLLRLGLRLELGVS